MLLRVAKLNLEGLSAVLPALFVSFIQGVEFLRRVSEANETSRVF